MINQELVRLLQEQDPNLPAKIEVEILGAGTTLVDVVEVRRCNDTTEPSPRVQIACEPIQVAAELKINEN